MERFGWVMFGWAWQSEDWLGWVWLGKELETVDRAFLRVFLRVLGTVGQVSAR